MLRVLLRRDKNKLKEKHPLKVGIITQDVHPDLRPTHLPLPLPILRRAGVETAIGVADLATGFHPPLSRCRLHVGRTNEVEVRINHCDAGDLTWRTRVSSKSKDGDIHDRKCT